MKPQTVGRVLGVGLRVAGRMAGQRLSPPIAGAASPATAPRPSARQTGVKAARVSTHVAKGVGGFLRPFRRVGGILFLEITGAFFFLFVVLFGNWAWKLRSSFAQGPDHTKFLIYCAMTALFLYLSLSSFWRARRK